MACRSLKNNETMEHPREDFYSIRIVEQLDSGWSRWFENMNITSGPAGETETRIEGFVTDQAALHGLLMKIRDLNLTLIAVERLTSDSSGNPSNV